MRSRVNLADALAGQVRVELGGADASMAEQGLDHAQVGSALQQMSGKAVPKGVWRHPLVDAGGLGPALHEAPYGLPAHPVSALANEDRRGGPGGRPCSPRTGAVPMQALARLVAHRHAPLLVALADDANLLSGKVDPVGVEADQLADPQPARVEQLQDGPIPDGDRVV